MPLFERYREAGEYHAGRPLQAALNRDGHSIKRDGYPRSDGCRINSRFFKQR
jgi:hypothetical protein